MNILKSWKREISSGTFCLRKNDGLCKCADLLNSYCFIHNILENSSQIMTENVRICFLFTLLFVLIPQMSAEIF